VRQSNGPYALYLASRHNHQVYTPQRSLQHGSRVKNTGHGLGILEVLDKDI
jgi:hypothetical protein